MSREVKVVVLRDGQIRDIRQTHRGDVLVEFYPDWLDEPWIGDALVWHDARFGPIFSLTWKPAHGTVVAEVLADG